MLVLYFPYTVLLRGISTPRDVEFFQKKLLKMILGVANGTPISFLYTKTGTQLKLE